MIKKTHIKSNKLQNSFKMFRIQSNSHTVKEDKDDILNKINDYLEQNDG